MGHMDQFSKAVLWRHAGDIVRFVLKREVLLAPFATEIPDKPRQRLGDSAFLTLIETPELCIHFEVQSAQNALMPFRALEYGVRLIMSDPEHPRHVLSIILWLVKHEHIPEVPLKVIDEASGEVWWEYINVKVFELSKADLAEAGVGMLVLAPLVTDVQPQDYEGYLRRIYTLAGEADRTSLAMLFLAFAEEHAPKGAERAAIRQTVLNQLREVGIKMDVIDEMLVQLLEGMGYIERAERAAQEKAEREIKEWIERETQAIRAAAERETQAIRAAAEQEAKAAKAAAEQEAKAAKAATERATKEVSKVVKKAAKQSAEEHAHTMARLWQKKFGTPMPDALIKASKTISQETFEQIMEAFLDGGTTPAIIRALLT